MTFDRRRNNQHPAELLTTCWGDRAPIDVELVPIITALWRAGVITNWCCQGDDFGEDHDHGQRPGWAVVGFPDIDQADHFARLLLDAGAYSSQLLSWEWTICPLRSPLATAPVNVHIPRATCLGRTVAHWLPAEVVRVVTGHCPPAPPGDKMWTLVGSAFADLRGNALPLREQRRRHLVELGLADYLDDDTRRTT